MRDIVIAVLIKQIRHLYAGTGRDAEHAFTVPGDYVFLNNPLDETALEKAVQIRDHLGAGVIWAFSLGASLMDDEARRAMAMGADHFVHISDAQWAAPDAWAAAFTLSRAVKRVDADLVLCGSRSLDLDRGEVPCYVASLLGYPCVSSAVGLDVSASGRLRITRALGKGRREEVECMIPAVISVEKNLCEPRYPSYAALLRAESREIITWASSDLGFDPGDLPVRMAQGVAQAPRPHPKWSAFPDASQRAIDRITFLLSPSAKEKKAALLQGEPSGLADELLAFLAEKGFLREPVK
ncbi:MAG: hypothetical protein V2B18_01535 [Pseudomonadota bacterium]